MIPERAARGPDGDISGRHGRWTLTFAGEMSATTWPAQSSRWLIVNYGVSHIRLFTIRFAGGEEVLPVFGHSEEAGRFLRLAVPDGEWKIRETWDGELISILFSLGADIQRVVLDPSPEADFETWADLVSLGRMSFIDLLMDEEKSAAS